MGFMDALLKNIEERGIPAHAPIEQRWTSSSSSKMSPAFGPPGDLFSWVGIIMYLPISESDGIDQLRRDITNRFNGEYCDLLREIGKDPKYKAVSHWAKLEIPSTVNDLVQLKKCIGNKYPLDDFNALRLEYDPKNILGNHWTHLIIGSPGSKDPWKSR
jgi:L-galactono-1,4-lactone dehydrogenase